MNELFIERMNKFQPPDYLFDGDAALSWVGQSLRDLVTIEELTN